MPHRFLPRTAALALAIVLTAPAAALPPPPPVTDAPAPAGLLFVDASAEPRLTVSWTDKSGTEHRLEGARPYAVDAERTPLGENLTAYAAVGGTRLAKAAGHPRGAIVRCGFYKAENAKPFFGGVGTDTLITVEMRGVRFNQPVDAHAASIVQHLKYDRGEMQACGLPGDAREQFNLVSPDETLNNRIRPGVDARQGVLDGSGDSMGDASLIVEDDGSVTMRVSFRYPVLRNLRDPWKSDIPGTFLEPFHFHLEFEVLPEGVEPLPSARPQH